jgi:uncharacterized protein (UPF0332 family)
VKRETLAHVEKARHCLIKAQVELVAAATEPRLVEDVARNAYYVAFHAAQALIFERTDKSSKTHAGVHRQFHRLTREEPTIPTALRGFLNSAYDFKATADYDTEPNRLTLPQASAAIAT